MNPTEPAAALHLGRTARGWRLRLRDTIRVLPSFSLDHFLSESDPLAAADEAWARAAPAAPSEQDAPLLAPIESQEVWAAGVTYLRSRSARMEESEGSGAASLYDKVYEAERPELFFKATPHRVAGPGQSIAVRSDSHWNVPEPELTLLLSAHARIVGFTVGNDVSSRDIEGENLLYLPQAKIFRRCCALGPEILLAPRLPPQTEIRLIIERGAIPVFSGQTALSQIKRPLPQLVEFLFRDNEFPHGAFLLTGTGIVPPSDFSLAPGDRVSITIPPIGTLENPVA